MWRRHGGVDIACGSGADGIRLRLRVCMGTAGLVRLIGTGVHKGQVVRLETGKGLSVTPASSAALVKKCVRHSSGMLLEELDTYISSFPVECRATLDSSDVRKILARLR